MPASEAVIHNSEPESLGLRRVIRENLQQFCDECDRFIKKQYEEIITGNPSADQREYHREQLKWALRTAKLLECVAADPDSSTFSGLAQLRAKIWQLEQSWKSIYEPMAEGEAHKLLVELF